MKFKMPDSLEGKTLEQLDELRTSALSEAKDLISKGADMSDEELAEAEALSGHVGDISAAHDGLTAAAAERDQKIADLKSRIEVDEPEEEEASEATDSDEGAPAEEPNAEEIAEEIEEIAAEDPNEEPKDKDEDDEFTADPEAEETTPDVEEAPELVAALEVETTESMNEEDAVGATKTVSKAAAHAADIEEDINEVSAPRATVTAAAAFSGYEAGAELDDANAIADAFLGRIRTIGRGNGGNQENFTGRMEFSGNGARVGVARMQRPENEFVLAGSTEEQFATIMAAASEKRLNSGSLTAAGGWCAPSTQLWDTFLELESVDNTLDLPSVSAPRGGIQFTKGPQLSDLVGIEGGFLQTEAEAEAGTEKTCYSIECPEWEEVRLDAVGFCLTSGILTNAAYPELVRRTIALARIAHRLKVNGEKIKRISDSIGDTANYTAVGASTSDILDALTLQALRVRFLYSMAEGATIEAILPLWTRDLIRADLSRRTGQDFLAVSNAQIDSYFRVRGINPQFVRGYQDLLTTAEASVAFPTSIEAMLYPAGSYVALEKDVIDLDAIYDSVNTKTNSYTAVFFEEGLAVANTGATGVKVTIPVDVQGLTGFPAVGAGEGITFGAAAGA
ncbi:MAG: major capsid protein [Brevibacterium aurantiacum]